MNKFIPYAKQTIEAQDIESVKEALNQPLITRGPMVESFEKEVADYVNAAYAVSFNSGTSALYAACYAAKVSPNDECITTPNSFIASAGSAAFYGATPVFLDIDRKTGNFDLKNLPFNLETKKSRGKKIIMPVHFAGIPMDIEKMERMICDPETIIIEDAAHALGSSYPDGSKVGSCQFSQMTIFSFHPAKQITTGEGGMVLTNDEALFNRLKFYRNNGIVRDENKPWYYEVKDLTGNFHLTEFQAALGLSQMKRLPSIVQNRRTLMKAYRQLLKGVPHVTLFTSEFDENVSFHLCVAQIDFEACKTNRTEVMHKLKDKGIGTQYHYIPIYQHPCFFKENQGVSDYFPEMEGYFKEALSLPLYADLQLEEVEYIVNSLKQVLQLSR